MNPRPLAGNASALPLSNSPMDLLTNKCFMYRCCRPNQTNVLHLWEEGWDRRQGLRSASGHKCMRLAELKRSAGHRSTAISLLDRQITTPLWHIGGSTLSTRTSPSGLPWLYIVGHTFRPSTSLWNFSRSERSSAFLSLAANNGDGSSWMAAICCWRAPLACRHNDDHRHSKALT